MSDILSRLEFNYVPPEDDTVDGGYDIFLDGEETAFSIQTASRGFCVNEHGYEVPGDEDSFYAVFHGAFGSLEDAKRHSAEMVKKTIEAQGAGPSAP